MDIKILLFIIGTICISVNGSSFSDFQKAMEKAAKDLSNIDKASADRFSDSVGLTTTTTTTTPPPPPESCGGWFQKACPSSTTTTPAPTPAPKSASCGGWLQKACPPTTTTTTTTPASEPVPKSSGCGGWFQPACEKPIGLSATLPTTTVEPTTTKPCGGWFQSACEKPAGLSATVATTTTAPTTSKPCGGWFQSACETTVAPARNCGWLGCSEKQTYAVATEAPSSSGWISGMLTSLTSTAGKAVGTALDVTSKIATTAMNSGVDFFVKQIQLFVKVTNMDVVPLPDIDIPLFAGASLKASGGYFKSLLSLQRGGDITISRDGLAFILDFSIAIKDMEIGFKNYSITVIMGMGTSGDIKVGVKENKINVRIRLAVSTSCAINVEKVDFAVLEGLDIHMSYGCKTCGYITDKATSYLANFLKNTIRIQIQNQIDSILKQTLSENSLICSKFMGG